MTPLGISFRDLIHELIVDHWAKMLVAVLLVILGRWWGWWRAHASWQKKEFRNHLTVSLNTIYENPAGHPTLGIRTLLEKSLDEVFLNRVAVDRFLECADQTTPERSLISIPVEDRWHLLNSVLNEVAEKFAAGMIDRDLEIPVRVERYLVFLTREIDGDVRIHKPRAMVVRKDRLLAGDFAVESGLKLESPHHRKRLATLAEAREMLQNDPTWFVELEIARPNSVQT